MPNKWLDNQLFEENEWLKDGLTWGAGLALAAPVIIAVAPVAVAGLGVAGGLIATTALGVGLTFGGAYLTHKFQEKIEDQINKKNASREGGTKKEGHDGAEDLIDKRLLNLEQKLDEQNTRLDLLGQENAFPQNEVSGLSRNLESLRAFNALAEPAGDGLGVGANAVAAPAGGGRPAGARAAAAADTGAGAGVSARGGGAGVPAGGGARAGAGAGGPARGGAPVASAAADARRGAEDGAPAVALAPPLIAALRAADAVVHAADDNKQVNLV